MKRTPLLRKTPLRQRRREGADLEREPRPMALPTVLPIVRGVYAGSTTGPMPKSPADRLQALRDLARGEECQGKRYGGWCRCHPDTVVWAHPNTLGERKGLSYKANDSAGAFLGAECHAFVDQPHAATYEQRAAVFAAAQERTTSRLREIVNNPLLKPWRRAAAAWALERRDG